MPLWIFPTDVFSKDMSFSEPLQGSCFRVAFISGDENINHIIFFFISYFPFNQAFLEFSEVAAYEFFEVFRKLLGKNSVVESMPSDSAVLSSAKNAQMGISWKF